MIILGDCLEHLRHLENDSIDSLITDPPAGISFMGKAWDDDKGGRKQWIAWMSDVMKECLRVLKPGAHGLVWAIPRTSHWTATALEDAGFEIRDVITHLFGSGFPKSMDISKAIDKAAGAEREVIGSKADFDIRGGNYCNGEKAKLDLSAITAPSTAEAKQWQGWGTALKPASEHWILIRKPCSEKTVAANVLRFWTGALNIDGSRVGSGGHSGGVVGASKSESFGKHAEYIPGPNKIYTQGRFPANLLLSHTEDCVEVGTKKIKAIKGGNSKAQQKDIYGKFNAPLDGVDPGYGDPDGTETVAAWECTLFCPVRMLDEQSGNLGKSAGGGKKKGVTYGATSYKFSSNIDIGNEGYYGDSGGASRFFYTAKASKREKNAGCEGLEDKILARSNGSKSGNNDDNPEYNEDAKSGYDKRILMKNHHPTVKPLKLMTYLITLITPPDGVVLDPFMGSGSTGVAALKCGFKFIGIEQESQYILISYLRFLNELK